MGFKRVILHRAFIDCDSDNEKITEMDDNNNNPDQNNGERKHTDFSIERILSNESPPPRAQRSASVSSTTERFSAPINDYAHWNRRIYPPISNEMPHIFLPSSPTTTATTTTRSRVNCAQTEIINLSLRMCGQPSISDRNIPRNFSLNDTRPFSLANSTSAMAATSASMGSYDSAFRKFEQYRSFYSLNQNFHFFGFDLSLAQSTQAAQSGVVKSEQEISLISNSDLACSVCNKVFESSEVLKMHEQTHKSPKYKCEECGKGFSQLRNFKYHVSVHKGTKEFAAKCPECDKLFNDKGYLSSHLKIHRNKKEYVCPHCPKSFNQRVAFNMHARIHSGIKPHKCQECGKCFSRKMLLKQHLRTHSGEKPYQCSICLKTFADRSNMTLHQRLHSGIKPFVCTMCPKAFTKKHHLKTHLNYHIGCKPYICPHPNCGKSFTQSSNMRTHSRKCEFRPPENPQ